MRSFLNNKKVNNKKGDGTQLLTFLVWMVLAIPIFFLVVFSVSSYFTMNRGSASDMNSLISDLDELNVGSTKTIVLHNMEPLRDYVVFMGERDDLTLRLCKNNRDGECRGEERHIKFQPTSDCENDVPCVCIFKNVDLRNPRDPYNIIPSSALCRILPDDFKSGPIPVMATLTTYDLEEIERTVIEQGLDDISGDDLIQSGILGVTIGVSASFLVVSVGTVLLSVFTGGIAIPIVLGGIAGVGVYTSVLQLSGLGYEFFQVLDSDGLIAENVLVYANPNENARSMHFYFERVREYYGEDTFLVSCPIIQYCNQLSHAIRVGQEKPIDYDGFTFT